jgi:tripartite-type tricarboxylate transporter receptor subunit TctC
MTIRTPKKPRVTAIILDRVTCSPSILLAIKTTINGAVKVPSGTPPAIISKLNKELMLVTQEPSLKAWAQSQNGQMLSSTPQELADFMKSDLAKWAPVVKETGIVPE